MLKRSILALFLLVVAFAALVYHAAPTAIQEYVLDDVSFYIGQLTQQKSHALLPGFYHYTNFLRNVTGFDALQTVRVSKLLFLLAVPLLFLIVLKLTRSIPLALVASFLYAFNAYTFNLVTSILRQMFAGLFMLAFVYAVLMFLNKRETGGHTFRRRLTFDAVLSLIFFLAVGLTHEFTFLIVIGTMFVFAFLVLAGTKEAEKFPLPYLFAFLIVAFAGVSLFTQLVNLVLPNHFAYSSTIYGLAMVLKYLTPTKVFLVFAFALLLAAYGYCAYRCAPLKKVGFQQKLIYGLGVLSLVLLVYPVGWAVPGIVFLLGFYFVFYYFYGVLFRVPSQAELFLTALFFSTVILSRNILLGLDFYMLRFELEVSLPFLALAALGLQTFFAEYCVGRLSAPFTGIIQRIDFSLGRKLIVGSVLSIALLSNLLIIGLSPPSNTTRSDRPAYLGILTSDYFPHLLDANLLATREIISLYVPLGKNVYESLEFWGADPREASSILHSHSIDYLVIAGKENIQIPSFSTETKLITRSYKNLDSLNLDKTFDSGLIDIYKFDYYANYVGASDEKMHCPMVGSNPNWMPIPFCPDSSAVILGR